MINWRAVNDEKLNNFKGQTTRVLIKLEICT